MKLFLASAFDKTAKLFKDKVPGGTQGKKVIFIANAADKIKGDKWWLKLDHEAFVKLGCEVVGIDLRDITKLDFTKALEESDIIHFCGGSVIYLIWLIRERGLDKLLTDYVKKEEIIYTGTSAGSMIMAQDMTLCAFDPEEKEFVDKMKDKSGLGWINFMIMPHANNKEMAPGNALMVSELPEIETTQPLIFIYDNQAVWVVDDKFEIISTPKAETK